MTEGLKDAGWATDSAYVEKLKAVMDRYGLRAFDAMAPGDLANPSAGGASVVAAAFSQLGVPYVWGGTTPGVGLDCSGSRNGAIARPGYRYPAIPRTRRPREQRSRFRWRSRATCSGGPGTWQST